MYIQSDSNSVISFANLVEVGNSLSIQQGAASYNFPALTTVGSSLQLSPDFAVLDGDLAFPALETVSDNLQVTNSSLTDLTGFSALTSLRSLNVSDNTNLATVAGFPSLESVSDNLEIRNNSSLASISGFEALESARYVYIYGNSLLDALSGFGVLSSVQDLNVYDNPLLAASLVCVLMQSNTNNYNIYNLLDSFDLGACDLDEDGFTTSAGDCDDGNANSYPGATEICDAQDNDCDGAVPSVESDADGDGYLLCADDCDDTSAAFNPGAPDICDDNLDQNCDGADSTSADLDGDGVSSCDGDCDDSDPANTSLLGSTACPAANCLAIASTDLVNAGDAVYFVQLADGNVDQVYCEMSTSGGGWTLFAITDSDECAENLSYGGSGLTDINGSPYITTLLQDEVHSSFLQVFQADGSTTDFTIVYTFGDGPATLSDRIDLAVASGVSVSWAVNHQGTSYSLRGTWRYSNGANSSDRWSTSGSNFSNDDGSWGAAGGVVDGNSPGPNLREHTDSWGHENPNSGDSECQQYLVNGSQNSSSSIRNYMFYR